MSDKIFVTDQRSVLDRYDSYSLDELMARLTAERESIPKECRSSVRFCIDMMAYEYDSSEYPKLFMTWQRPETDAEMAERVLQDALCKKRQEERDLKEFERLSKKFKQT